MPLRFGLLRSMVGGSSAANELWNWLLAAATKALPSSYSCSNLSSRDASLSSSEMTLLMKRGLPPARSLAGWAFLWDNAKARRRIIRLGM